MSGDGLLFSSFSLIFIAIDWLGAEGESHRVGEYAPGPGISVFLICRLPLFSIVTV